MLGLVIALSVAAQVCADTYHVTVDGVDTDDRDGKSLQTAWKSLAYAARIGLVRAVKR